MGGKEGERESSPKKIQANSLHLLLEKNSFMVIEPLSMARRDVVWTNDRSIRAMPAVPSGTIPAVPTHHNTSVLLEMK